MAMERGSLGHYGGAWRGLWAGARDRVWRPLAIGIAAWLVLVLTSCSSPGTPAKTGGADAAKAGKTESVFGGTERISSALVGKVYLLPENTPKLPTDFSVLKPEGTIYASKIDVPDRSWTEGFPGVTDRFEWFAIEYKGSFAVQKPGKYTLRLLSDDGSKLFIDGKLVIDNDGTHGATSVSKTVDLDDSSHAMTLQYFQGPRTEIALQLFYTPDGGVEQIFPGKDFLLTTPSEGFSLWWLLVLILIVLFVVLYFARRRKEPEPVRAEESEGTEPTPPAPS